MPVKTTLFLLLASSVFKLAFAEQVLEPQDEADEVRALAADPEFDDEPLPDADELEEMQAIEAAEIDAQLDYTEPLTGLQLLGAAHPLRTRRLGPETAPTSEIMPAQGDAGELVPELAGLDLATLKARYDIPVEINEDVAAYIRFFQGRGRRWFERWLERGEKWIPLMRPILAEEGVPLDLVYLAMIESGFSAHATSWASASGFWQFMAPTGRRFGLREDFWVDERRDPVMSTRAAARYLKTLHREFDDWYIAWAGYNAGEGKMRRAIRMYGTRDFWELTRAGPYLKKETKHYVPKLIAAAIISKHLDRFGFEQPPPQPPFEFELVELPDATDIGVVAKAAGVDVKQVQELNMKLRRWATPPAQGGKGYAIKVPLGTKERFLEEYAKIQPSERLTYRRYVVKAGDTLGAISQRYSMSVAAVMSVNGIKNPRHLRIGQNLIIPVSMRQAGKHPDTPSVRKAPQARTARQAQASSKRLARDVERQVSAPAGSQRYVVRRGDTLWSIARKFGVDVASLKKWNGLGANGHRTLQVGHTLYVAPAAAAGATRG